MPPARHTIVVQVFDEFKDSIASGRVRTLARRALSVALPGSTTNLSVVIADDQAVRELNKRHRGLDETTDVLSFSFSHQGAYYGDGPAQSQWNKDTAFVLPPGSSSGIGEIVISYPQMLRQAKAHGKAPEEELAFLLSHGVLHLLGHDHEEPRERAAMEAEQASLMERMLGKR
ncbi:MAG: rRNA maturation RNase YbeY [SAR202 cluster bacterium]|nr:rRNA maturation RNase YbeY [SAR202 cluster bacterium]